MLRKCHSKTVTGTTRQLGVVRFHWQRRTFRSSMTSRFEILLRLPKEVGVAPDGKLIFKHDVNTKLEVQTVAVLGELEIGTSANPVDSSVTAEMEFPRYGHRYFERCRSCPIWQWIVGNWYCCDPVSTVHRIPKTFLRTTVEPSATDTTLTLSEAPTGWKAGDRIVIPDTRALQPSETHRQGTYNPQWETLTIDSIATNVVTITGSLAYDHDGSV